MDEVRSSSSGGMASPLWRVSCLNRPLLLGERCLSTTIGISRGLSGVTWDGVPICGKYHGMSSPLNIPWDLAWDLFHAVSVISYAIGDNFVPMGFAMGYT